VASVNPISQHSICKESSKDFNLPYTSFQVDKEKGFLKIQLAPRVCPFLFGKCEVFSPSENSVYIKIREKKF
jgi:hypothetical protein